MRVCDRCEVPIYPCPTGPVLVGDPPRQMPMMWCEGWLHRGGWHRCRWPGGVYGESATPRDPFADVTVWFPGEGPVPIAGECPHYTCMHAQQALIGWGPDQLRYQAIRCDVPLVEGGCAGGCRVMVNVANVWSSPWWFTAQTPLPANRHQSASHVLIERQVFFLPRHVRTCRAGGSRWGEQADQVTVEVGTARVVVVPCVPCRPARVIRAVGFRWLRMRAAFGP